MKLWLNELREKKWGCLAVLVICVFLICIMMATDHQMNIDMIGAKGER